MYVAIFKALKLYKTKRFMHNKAYFQAMDLKMEMLQKDRRRKKSNINEKQNHVNCFCIRL